MAKGVKKGSTRGKYKRELTISDLYAAYQEQFEKSKKILEKNNISKPGLRLAKESEWTWDMNQLSKSEFARAFADELEQKDKYESKLNLAKRMAREEVTNTDKGLFKSVEHAFNTGEMFAGTDLTLNQINYKMRYDVEFRNDYFDKINVKYAELRDNGSSAADAKIYISQYFFGSN